MDAHIPKPTPKMRNQTNRKAHRHICVVQPPGNLQDVQSESAKKTCTDNKLNNTRSNNSTSNAIGIEAEEYSCLDNSLLFTGPVQHCFAGPCCNKSKSSTDPT